MKKHHAIGIGGVVLLIIVILGVVLLLNQPAKAPAASKSQTSSNQGVTKLESTDEVVGTGAEAVAGKQVTVNYVGTLTNGTTFDSSYSRNQPFTFTLGAGQVIKGWDQGVVGMKVGGKRKLVIPADLAYGSQSPSAAIPPNSTLVFEIELVSVQ
jgi:FKBP-type peptidyl-prolyl cis-trans isomerase